MDNDFILRQFEKIEQKVEKLIEDNKESEVLISELNNKIERLEKELEEKEAAKSRYMEERDLIGSKIDDVLKKLDDIA